MFLTRSADHGTREILTQLTKAFTPPKLLSTSPKQIQLNPSTLMASPAGETSLVKEVPIIEEQARLPKESHFSILTGPLDQTEPSPSETLPDSSGASSNPGVSVSVEKLIEKNQPPINNDQSDDVLGWDKERFMPYEREEWERTDKELRNIRKFVDPNVEALCRLWKRQEPASALTCLWDASEKSSWLNMLFLYQKVTIGPSLGKVVPPSPHDPLNGQAVEKTDRVAQNASNISRLASAEIGFILEIKRQLWNKEIGPIPESFEVQGRGKDGLTPSDVGAREEDGA